MSLVILSSKIYSYKILLPIAVILILCKLFSLLFKKINIPQVVGMLLAGVLIGLTKLIPGCSGEDGLFLSDQVIEGLQFFAEIGVILIMFSAGIETDIKQIKQTGVAAIVVTALGVICPMAFGFLVAGLFNGFTQENVWSNLFYGVILTATSVSVTVATLKELGKLNSKVGTAIVSAAILDDIIGVVVLSVILTLGNPETASNGALDILIVIAKTIGFFVCVFVLGFAIKKIFNAIEKKHPHNRRIPIFSIAFCFLLAYLAEAVFGIADITGAYAAGLILAGRKTSSYVERRTDIASYIIFSPVFFAKIGITIDFSSIGNSFSGMMIAFGLCYILAGVAGKIIGCGAGAKICKYSWKESFRVGVGMMCRAEVCLICADKGISAGIIDPSIQPYIVLLIILTSFVTPILLKVSYHHRNPEVELNESISTDIPQENQALQEVHNIFAIDSEGVTADQTEIVDLPTNNEVKK